MTDEQFREVREQIVERLHIRVQEALAEAIKAVENAALNPQNPVNPFIELNLEHARAFFQCAGLIKGMERDGYDWNKGMDR